MLRLANYHVLASWEALRDAGVPHGASSRVDPSSPPDLAVLALAVRAVLKHPEELDPRQRVSLLAWLSAWKSGWPSSFQTTFAEGAMDLLAAAALGVDDTDRYLKLRRLARANLAQFL
jgi:hypothetical protein